MQESLTTREARLSYVMSSSQEYPTGRHQEIEQFCSEYDYSEDVKANGFRSFLRIYQKFHEQVANNDDVDDSEKEKIRSLLQAVQRLIMRSRDRGQEDFSEITDIDNEVMLASFAEAPEPEPKHAAYGEPFWLKEELRIAIHEFKFLNADSGGVIREVASQNILKGLNFVPIARSNEWVIEVTGSGSKVTKNDFRAQEMIDCLIITPDDNRHPNSLLFYSYGGGFMHGSVSECGEQAAELCNKVGVVTVIPEYRKAPVNRFPAGLQDVLDAYCFFTSGSETVKQLIGFNPDKVVVAGDSSGGNFSASITFALHMIREAGGTVQIPAGIHLLYPYSSPVPIAYPSMLMQNVYPLISAEYMAKLMVSYPKTDPLIEDGWHACPNSQEVIELLQPFARDPLFNNLAWKDWQSLKDIPLVVHVSEFDPLMDSGIQFAKRWQGNTRVRTAWGNIHGFADMAVDASREDLQIMYDDMSDLFSGNV